jgi:hypothetical protein
MTYPENLKYTLISQIFDDGVFAGTNRKKFSGSGTGCTQPREYKLRSYLIEK